MKIQLGDLEVAYTVQGVGPPVVLIHGLAEDKTSWSGVQDRLEDFRTLAYDFRGHGETTLGGADGTLEQLGSDLIAFLEQVTGPAQCVGYSLGGTLVLWTAMQRPELVTAAVVTGTSTVVGWQAVGFFEERIRVIEQDFAAFAPALQKDTALQIVTSGVDLEAVTARRLEAVGSGGGYVNAARAMMRLHENPLTPLTNMEPPSVHGQPSVAHRPMPFWTRASAGQTSNRYERPFDSSITGNLRTSSPASRMV